MKKQILTIIAVIIMLCNVNAQGGAAINTSNSAADPSAILDVSSTSQGILVPRMTELQKNSIHSPANGLIIYQIDGSNPGIWYYDNTTWVQPGASSSVIQHYIGELYGGGVVFYVYDNGQHGLIASLVNISSNAIWSDVGSTLAGTNSWDGSGNTIAIINQPGHTNSAAKLCDDYFNADYGTGIFNDWYLPAFDEIIIIYNNMGIINYIINKNFGPNEILLNDYWTSTEYNATDVWKWNMANGTQYYNAKSSTKYVRAIRSF